MRLRKQSISLTIYLRKSFQASVNLTQFANKACYEYIHIRQQETLLIDYTAKFRVPLTVMTASEKKRRQTTKEQPKN